MSIKNNVFTAERRSMVRADRIVAVKHRLIERNSKLLPGAWSLSTTRNMSASGLLFLSDTSYKKGDTLEMSVVISGVIDIVKGNARVVRVVENGDTSFDVAVQYISKPVRKRPAKSHF
jgi:hypothetical protein